MTLWLALRRLLPLLAVLSLALTPVTAPAATAGMHASMAWSGHAATTDHHGKAGMDHAATGHHAAASVDMAGMDMAGMDMDDMPCCPKSDAAKPDCAKGCPLMALCLASVASLLPGTEPVPVPVAVHADVTWPDPAAFASVHGSPLPEPPRA
ncbi:hypothetical protein MMSR116_15745 [Methylobacterium mesophilicum SR1.6/6]|uniref:CopL family metal-binding regulatory protein n=1 Tax=Methylobacterium mesophilicum SR1.6/6 TaxID=908290 RepID=A0A6B9FQE4_9HYPH|nr:hypothetical protein [Methylobacterium mesophilicum]QGY03175.1 hypothetical protein MMSR116_15745 [Methylobacterium mesophilicum SR1.6/6]